MLTVYNTLSKQKEVFTPIREGHISLYVCGVTVYDLCHIGHARTYVAFDMITRFLRYCGYTVKHVQNITDIDDKIIKRANERGISTAALVEENVALMNAHFSALNILPPTQIPRATENIEGMIDLIQSLIDKDYAYQAQNGDVLYRVKAFQSYGALSGQNLEALQAGSRVEVEADKENPLDFVLWKPAKKDEPSWPSPWGHGRPGWHIECSAMTKACLGETFDIHAGGSDLRFPHHENEIAQSEAANGCKYARYWLHSGMVQVDNEKMSKSLGNFFTIESVLAHFSPEVVRTFLLMGHYRSEIHYSVENLNSAKQALTRLYTTLRGLTDAPPLEDSQYEQDFRQALEDDFNTPEAFAVLFALSKAINTAKSESIEQANRLGATLKKLAGILGLLHDSPEHFFHGEADQAILDKIAARNAARDAKNWAESDRLRDDLLAMGIAIEDTKDGTQWKRIS